MRTFLGGDIGGKDFDDLKSVGDQSDTETVWEDDYDEDEDFEDDDVSPMGDDAGFEDDDEESDAEATRNEDDRYGGEDDDEEEDEMEYDDEDDDSACSTKVSGRYKKRADGVKLTVHSLLEENQRLREENTRRLIEMEAKFTEMLHNSYAANAAAAKSPAPAACSDVDEDGDQKMPAKEVNVDKVGTDVNSGGQEAGATGGSNAEGDISQTGETSGASAGIK